MSPTTPNAHVAFLPGAGGAGTFWLPVSDLLPGTWARLLLNWPGAGDQPHDPRVAGYDDLIAHVAAQIGDRTDVVAQSMGGIVAIGLALKHPEKVRRLVLTATSGGIDVMREGAADWRDDYRQEYPLAAEWIWRDRVDYTHEIASLRNPTLLIWGDRDPISPVAVGERLHGLLHDSALHVLAGGTHSLAQEQPREVAALIVAHLG